MEASHERFTHFDVRRVTKDGLQIRKRNPESTESVLPVGTQIIIPNRNSHPEEWLSIPRAAIPIRLLRDPEGYWSMAWQVLDYTSEQTSDFVSSA